MYVPFAQLPPQSRVWIYQASRNFTPAETETLKQKAAGFAEVWAAHGVNLQASAEVLHNAFLVLAVNQDAHSPSGCSIDSSVNFIRGLEQEFSVQFFDRTQLAFLQNGQVVRVAMSQMKQAVADGKLAAETPFFDNRIETKQDLERAWPLSARNTWAAKYFEVPAGK